MWKFQDFSATQILREINFVESRSSKTAHFAIFFALLVSRKLISRKIRVIEKSRNFHTHSGIIQFDPFCKKNLSRF